MFIVCPLSQQETKPRPAFNMAAAGSTTSNIADDDDNDWIPLQTYGNNEANLSERSAVISKAPVNNKSTTSTKQEFSAGSNSNSTDASRSPRGSNPPERESLSSIRTKLESRVKVREDLVNHPLSNFWGRFFVNLASETWNQDATYRAGLALVTVGAALKFLWVLSISTQFWFHPRTIFLVVVMCLSWVYLLPTINVEKQVDKFVSWIMSPDAIIDSVATSLERIPLQLIFLFLLLTPTLLEARLLAFFATIVAEAGWNQNIACAIFILAWMYFQSSSTRTSPRDCSLQGLVILYAAALIVSIGRLDLGRIWLLAGPFCLATGTMLLVRSNEDEFRCSRIIRHALRLTLRDVLASVGEKVKEDEMLQIAMLRWIVDYWSSQASQQGSTRPATSRTPSVLSSTSTNQSSSGEEDRTTISHTRSKMQMHQQHELEWEELCSMLTMTTDQMGGEVHTSATSQPIPSSSSDTTQQQQSSQESNESLNNLTSMLASMDVNERARPAVLAYKQAIEHFPPARWIAEYVAILRRCPSILTLVCFYFWGSPVAISTTLTLAPFVIFEVLRVKKWARACRISFGIEGDQEQDEVIKLDDTTPLSRILSLPSEMESMTIVLSHDTYLSFQPTTMLLVWENVRASVVALEAGLTAARCVQTTAVAANFAGNVMSLAHFGVQVSRGGLLHGVGIVIGELVQMHAASNDPSTMNRNNVDATLNTRYTTAAINATKNGQILAREVGMLMEGGEPNPIIDPIVGVLSVVVGRGWLWGKEGDSESLSESNADNDGAKAKKGLEPTMATEAQKNEGKSESKQANSAAADAVKTREAHKDENGIEGQQANEASINDSLIESKASLKHVEKEDNLKRNVPTSEDKLPQDLADFESSPEATVRTSTVRQPDGLVEALDLENMARTATNAAEGQQDIADLMERLFDAYERELIMEDEKNALMESLASEDKSAIDVVRKSLDCVLDEDFLPADDAEPCPPTTTLYNPSEENFATNQTSDDDDQFEPIDQNASQGFGSETDSKKAMAADERQVHTKSRVETKENKGQKKRTETESATPIEEISATPSTVKNDDGNWLHLVGGGLAVVGAAVVGGMALAQQGGKSDDNEEKCGSERKTPYIEEIVEDEGKSNEWESVSAANTNVK